MNNRSHNRSLRTPLRRRLMVLGVLALSFHAPAMAKAHKPAAKHSISHRHHALHRHRVAPQQVAAPLEPVDDAAPYHATGRASWYGKDFHGRRTASGESFDRQDFTGAHRTLPFGTVVRVTNLRNGRSTEVRINDRGPFVANRIIDLSYAAARQIGMTARGVAQVKLEAVQPPKLAKDDQPSRAGS